MDMIAIETTDGPMACASAHPQGTPFGAVVVIQEAFGLTEHIVGLTDRFAQAGFRALAPALYHRQSSEPVAYDDYDAVIKFFEALTAEQITLDVDAAVALLVEEGFDPSSIGLVGFCMGGAIALATATQLTIGAAVSFYGGGVAVGRFGLPPLIELAPSLRAPWLGLYGDLDESIPVEQVEALRQAAETALSPTFIHRYADAGHGFHCNDRPAHFHADAAVDAWDKTLAFLNEYLETKKE